MNDVFSHTLPIVMWDLSWLECHHRYGDFEDFDKVIDGLVERGYEAVRIDAFPHLVARARNGEEQDTFWMGRRDDFGKALWGGSFTVELNVKECLIEFMQKLNERGLKIGLSTWLYEVYDGRSAQIGDVDDFIRIWDETLTFLADHDLLKNVIYVDLLNEFPLYHQYKWFLDTYSAFPEGSQAQHDFYIGFGTKALTELKKRWPGLRFMFSLSENHFSNYDVKEDFSLFDCMDVHIWMVHNKKLTDQCGYFESVHPYKSDREFRETNRLLHEAYYRDEAEYLAWMKEHLDRVAAIGQNYHIPVGNTEGWGAINWMDHPYLDWDIVKRAGLSCAQLAADAGYAFACSCNFCHPHFTGIWDDIQWHKKITSIIRSGKPKF